MFRTGMIWVADRMTLNPGRPEPAHRRYGAWAAVTPCRPRPRFSTRPAFLTKALLVRRWLDVAPEIAGALGKYDDGFSAPGAVLHAIDSPIAVRLDEPARRGQSRKVDEPR